MVRIKFNFNRRRCSWYKNADELRQCVVAALELNNDVLTTPTEKNG
jgi:hypothetical protein